MLTLRKRCSVKHKSRLRSVACTWTTSARLNPPADWFAACRRLLASLAKPFALLSFPTPDVRRRVCLAERLRTDHSPAGVALESVPVSSPSCSGPSVGHWQCFSPELPEPPPYAWKNASGSPSLSPYGPPCGTRCTSLLRWNFHIRSHLGPVVLQ